MIEVTSANIYLVATILLLSIFQKGRNRPPALFYSTLLILSTLITSQYDGYDFFILSALSDFVTVALVCIVAIKYCQSLLSDVLITLAMTSGAINAFGAFMWHNQEPLTQYYFMCMIVYTIAVLSLLMEDRVHDNRRSHISALFRVVGYPGYAIRCLVRGGEAS